MYLASLSYLNMVEQSSDGYVAELMELRQALWILERRLAETKSGLDLKEPGTGVAA